ncbi:MAG: hypothetical protein ACE5KV_07035 [Thermoplasmata archaeon]
MDHDLLSMTFEIEDRLLIAFPLLSFGWSTCVPLVREVALPSFIPDRAFETEARRRRHEYERNEIAYAEGIHVHLRLSPQLLNQNVKGLDFDTFTSPQSTLKTD